MSIEVSHWVAIRSAVEAHEEKLHPLNKKKQKELIEELLCIKSRETMLLEGIKADSAFKKIGHFLKLITK